MQYMFVSTKQNMELLAQDSDLAQEDQSAVQHLKLFGKNLLVKGSSGTSLSTIERNEGGDVSFPLKVIPLKLTVEHVDASPLVPFPWLMLSSSSTQQVIEKKCHLDNNDEKGASSSGSTTDSDREKSSDTNRKNANALASRLRKRASADFEDYRKGFVPYKRHSRQAEKHRSRICL